uniref:Uncharacterized protein n=1 Tax=Anguilla anguilla TaxID=7936 RepID=A0A0E9PJY3_ANGAN
MSSFEREEQEVSWRK